MVLDFPYEISLEIYAPAIARREHQILGRGLNSAANLLQHLYRHIEQRLSLSLFHQTLASSMSAEKLKVSMVSLAGASLAVHFALTFPSLASTLYLYGTSANQHIKHRRCSHWARLFACLPEYGEEKQQEPFHATALLLAQWSPEFSPSRICILRHSASATSKAYGNLSRNSSIYSPLLRSSTNSRINIPSLLAARSAIVFAFP